MTASSICRIVNQPMQPVAVVLEEVLYVTRRCNDGYNLLAVRFGNVRTVIHMRKTRLNSHTRGLDGFFVGKTCLLLVENKILDRHLTRRIIRCTTNWKGTHNMANDKRQFEAPNFVADGKLYLVRCYKCDPVNGRENYALAVSSGQCAWCGWKNETPDEGEEAYKEHTQLY